MKDLCDLLAAATRYQFDLEFSGTGLFRVVMEDKLASPWEAANMLSLVDAIAFVVTNSKKKPSE